MKSFMMNYIVNLETFYSSKGRTQGEEILIFQYFHLFFMCIALLSIKPQISHVCSSAMVNHKKYVLNKLYVLNRYMCLTT